MIYTLYRLFCALALAVILFNATVELRDRFSGCTTDSECERVDQWREGAQR